MKRIILLLVLVVFAEMSFAQPDPIKVTDTSNYKIIKTDGGELFGKILYQDAREVLLLTTDNREIYIPQHTIKEIVKLNALDFNNKGVFVGEDKFASRYFITTNGLPIEKGENYIQWNIFGPDFQFGLGKNFGVGIMTSWVGIPLIGTIKKSWELGDNTQFAIGALAGTGSWALPDWGGVLPYATLSFGDRRRNIAFSGGYGAVWQGGVLEGRALSSVAGMVKISAKFSLVLDSFILFPNKGDIIVDEYGNIFNSGTRGLALIIPGLRWHQGEGKAFQFGFTGIVVNGELAPIPIPMVQWYRTL